MSSDPPGSCGPVSTRPASGADAQNGAGVRSAAVCLELGERLLSGHAETGDAASTEAVERALERMADRLAQIAEAWLHGRALPGTLSGRSGIAPPRLIGRRDSSPALDPGACSSLAAELHHLRQRLAALPGGEPIGQVEQDCEALAGALQHLVQAAGPGGRGGAELAHARHRVLRTASAIR